MPAKAVRLTDEKVKRFDKVLATDSGRLIITTVWSPSSGAFFLDTSVYYKLQ